jgi:hypothetical protein
MPDVLGRLLVHPVRRRLLLEYAGGPDSPSCVAKRLDEPLNVVAYHTGVLLQYGCIELVRTERRRGALTHWYRATAAPVIDDVHWETLPVALRRALALGTVEQISESARRAAAEGGFDHRDAHVSRMRLELDQQGLNDVASLLETADAAVARISSAARERTPTGRAPHEVDVLGFEPRGNG